MAGAKHFRELVCWQLARDLKIELYRFVEQPHVRRDFRYCSQIWDTAASATSNIAEGFARRASGAVASLQRYLRR
jgi:four helix bundle protein